MNPEDTKVIPEILPGTIVNFAGATAPNGWVLCFGQSLNRVQYSDLFNIIGTAYGSVDANSFNVPEMRSRHCAGMDNMGGTAAGRLASPYIAGTTLGARGGAPTHTLTQAQCPNHQHTWNWLVGGAGLYWRGDLHYTYGANAYAGYVGGNQPHNNAQPIIILNKIIKI